MPEFRLKNAYRVLILAPTGRDGRLIASTLDDQKFQAESVSTMTQFCTEIGLGVGAAILTEEIIRGPSITALSAALGKQAAWSDLPLIILTASGNEQTSRTWELVQRLDPVGNVFLLERPLRP